MALRWVLAASGVVRSDWPSGGFLQHRGSLGQTGPQVQLPERPARPFRYRCLKGHLDLQVQIPEGHLYLQVQLPEGHLCLQVQLPEGHLYLQVQPPEGHLYLHYSFLKGIYTLRYSFLKVI